MATAVASNHMATSQMSTTATTAHWSTNANPNSLAHQFPSFQMPASQAGGVRVEARSPSGRVQEMSVGETGGVFTANFTPTEVGDWMVSILYEGQHIQGSPFNVRVYDAAQVKVFGLEGGSVGKTFSFSADCSGAGDGELAIDITHGGRTVPATIAEDGGRPGVYRVNFTPAGSGIYTIRVYFAGMEVSGSPYTLDIVDASRVTASGEGLSSVEVHRGASFIVNTHGATGGDVRVNVTSPRGAHVPAQVFSQGDGTFRVEYTPTDVGEYAVDVSYLGKPIAGSPYHVHAIDWTSITLNNLRQSGVVGKLVEFDIDAANAGSGNLEIMVNEGTIPCSVKNRGGRQFHASFMPKDAAPHYIQMKFNGREVPGSPWKVDIRGTAHITASGVGLGLVPIQRPATIDIRAGPGGPSDGVITATVLGPGGGAVPASVARVPGGWKVEYVAQEVGNHSVELQYDGVSLQGSPFSSKAYNAAAVIVGDVPPAQVGKVTEFTIDVSTAGEGQLEIMVNQGQVPNTVRMLRKGVFLVGFTPRDARVHTVDVRFNRDPVPRCPVMVAVLDASRVTVSGDMSGQVAVNSQASFRVQTAAAGEADLTVRVTSPTNELVPAKIVQQPDGDYKVEYSSKFTGRHKVEILYAGQPIMGSPFFVEIYDPNKIRVESPRDGVIAQPITFDVVTAEAGVAELGVTVAAPSGKQVACEILALTTGQRVTYVPQEPGSHQVYLTYGGLEVPGCPLTHVISDGGSVRVYGDGLARGQEDKSATFTVDSDGKHGELAIQVDGPNSLAKCRVSPDGNGRHQVTYTPVEVGVFTVQVKWNGREVEGSPWQPVIFNPAKVVVLDESTTLSSLAVNETRHLRFNASGAGPGTLAAVVTGPTGGAVPIEVVSQGGLWSVYFTPIHEGMHLLHVTYSDAPLPRSPFALNAVTATAPLPQPPVLPPVIPATVQLAPSLSHDKVILTGRGLEQARTQETAEFVIDATDAGPGLPEVTLTGVKQDIEVIVHSLGDYKFRCSYVPQAAGAYLLNIAYGERQVRGSPFKVSVTSQSDAAKVVCTGEGLKLGMLGREIKSVIDTRRAGPGELVAHCQGPTKEAFCELFDHRDGTFTLSVQPQETGKHALHVKYDAEHVAGSPYTLRVAAEPDASKVRVHGPGVEDGLLASFQSRFVVDTRGAGAGQLTVRIRGPKGAFRVEMQRESQKDRTILCRFDPTEVGVYVLHVRWSDKHVPGSPFQVHIFDTQQELERFTADKSRKRGVVQNGNVQESTLSGTASRTGETAQMDFYTLGH